MELTTLLEIAKSHGVLDLSDIEKGYDDDDFFSFADNTGEVYEVFNRLDDNTFGILFFTGAEDDFTSEEEFKQILSTYNF